MRGKPFARSYIYIYIYILPVYLRVMYHVRVSLVNDAVIYYSGIIGEMHDCTYVAPRYGRTEKHDTYVVCIAVLPLTRHLA